MEVRHNCCQAISKALLSSPKLTSDPALAGIAAKVRFPLGPYACLILKLQFMPEQMECVHAILHKFMMRGAALLCPIA